MGEAIFAKKNNSLTVFLCIFNIHMSSLFLYVFFQCINRLCFSMALCFCVCKLSYRYSLGSWIFFNENIHRVIQFCLIVEVIEMSCQIISYKTFFFYTNVIRLKNKLIERNNTSKKVWLNFPSPTHAIRGIVQIELISSSEKLDISFNNLQKYVYQSTMFMTIKNEK